MSSLWDRRDIDRGGRFERHLENNVSRHIELFLTKYFELLLIVSYGYEDEDSCTLEVG
jgi:hypothetical protein